MSGPADAPGAAGPAAGQRTAAERVVVRVDRDRCIGSGMCALTAPGSLELGADGLARPLRVAATDGGGGEDGDGGGGEDGAPAGAGPGSGEPLTERLAEAVDYCPVEALALYSAGDGRRIAPAR
ncbi:ferredoxin [Kitasatospora sp. CM 4170]|uniref:Ferredoxin n=1 Tax=Kitasatospora aburaviensis TaxID=67265 RepID=A0ABW1F059_9ACTN|nr:ferredoxin [Kitasatospora sp. CM 4170]WNM49301.1 ferredoxin [Kitasatospora sp. CM 4170]